MKYLFVIYTDLEYKEHLDHFKSQEFYGQVCDDPNIEIIEWGADFHTDYKDLVTKTQEMMKWCSENKEYDYLVKCDETIIWREDLKDKFTYENIFIENPEEYYGINEVMFDWKDEYPYSEMLLCNSGYKNEDLSKLDSSFCKITSGYFYDGKCYVVSKNFSSFIGKQKGLAEMFRKKLRMEDIMVSFIYREVYK